jgi:DNA adenine methylase
MSQGAQSWEGMEKGVVKCDCIGFIRHFLHIFHRLRMQFLEEYQRFVLAEPESALGQPLKEAFLALRAATETIDE